MPGLLFFELLKQLLVLLRRIDNLDMEIYLK